MYKRKVAIACQGGGSHAAFAAGVLCGLLADDWFEDQYTLTALSGTSGGAVCASLAWTGWVSGATDRRAEAIGRLRGFWGDLEASGPFDAWMNYWTVAAARLPVTVEVSPYLYWPFAEWRMRELLERYLQLEKLPRYPHLPADPKLLIGVTDILRGEGRPKVGETLTYDDVIASAAIPPLFRAVRDERNHTCYWDGLFNRNPPIREFTDLELAERPQEIWVVRLNPIERYSEPVSIRDIIDRRNELAGNLALDQELYHIGKVNELIVQKRLSGYQRIDLRQVQMPASDLDYPSKLDRSPSHLRALFDAGARAAPEFFQPKSIIELETLKRKLKASQPAPVQASPPVTRWTA